MTTGIYGIFDKRSGDCLYVGQSKSIEDRWRSHRKRLRSGRHLKSFSKWFEEQGSDISIVELKPLEVTDNTDEAKNEAEIRWFRELKPKFYGQIPSANNKGWSQATETKDRISKGVLKNRSKKAYVYQCYLCRKEFEDWRIRQHERIFCSRKCFDESRRIEYNKTIRLDLDEVVRLYYSEGLSSRHIGQLFNISDRSILKYLRDNGYTPRPRYSQANPPVLA